MPALLAIARLLPWWAWVALPLVLWVGWQRHTAQAATQARLHAEQQAAIHEVARTAEAAARQAEAQANTNARKVTDDAHRRTQAAQAAAAATAVDLQRLRSAIAAAAPASAAGADPAAAGSPDAAATARAVVDQCAGLLAAVAADADTCGATLSGLQAYVREVVRPQGLSP
jgi:hypothetical protein